MKVVYISYKGLSDEGKESPLRGLARKFKGTPTGSGYCFLNGMRDVSFEFKEAKQAANFIKAVKKIKGFKVN